MSSQPYKPLLLSLPQLAPTLAVEVLPQGVTIHRIYLQVDGKTHDIIIGPDDPTQYASPTHKYKNTIIGRYTNRIPVGSYLLTDPKDPSVTSSLTTLPNESPTVSLHGGPKGLDAYAFEPIDNPDDLLLFSPAEKELLKKDVIPSMALFKHVSPDGDQGYPGELSIEVLVGLVSPSDNKITSKYDEHALGSLFIVYRAKVTGKDGQKVVTPVNLTQHWGFNLDASLRGLEAPTVKHHLLHIASENILELGPGAIATGKLVPVKGTPHDHNNNTGILGERYPENGYDDFYLFAPPPNPAIIPGNVPLSSLQDTAFDLLSPVISNVALNPPSVVLSSPKSGLKVSFDTNQNGVQFWSCDVLNGSGATKRIHGGSGAEDGQSLGYLRGSAAFLEFHDPHAAFLHPELVENSITKNDTLLGSDELYHNYIKLDLRYQGSPETVYDT